MTYSQYRCLLSKYYRKAALLSTKDRVKLYVQMGISDAGRLIGNQDRDRARKELTARIKLPSQADLKKWGSE